jgi:hypothetical protein
MPHSGEQGNIFVATTAYTKIDALYNDDQISNHTRRFAKEAFGRLCRANKDYPTSDTEDMFIGASIAIASAQFHSPLTTPEISQMLSVPASASAKP